MEDNYNLPQYWCIEINEGNISLLKLWRRNMFGLTEHIPKHKWMYEDGTTQCKNVHIGITTELFIKYILKY